MHIYFIYLGSEKSLYLKRRTPPEKQENWENRRKLANDIDKQLKRRETQTANNYIKKCLTSLLRLSVRGATETKKHTCPVDENLNWSSHSSEKPGIKLNSSVSSVLVILGIFPKDIFSHMFINWHAWRHLGVGSLEAICGLFWGK